MRTITEEYRSRCRALLDATPKATKFVVAPDCTVGTKRGVLIAGDSISPEDIADSFRLDINGETGQRDKRTFVPAWQAWKSLVDSWQVLENYERIGRPKNGDSQ